MERGWSCFVDCGLPAAEGQVTLSGCTAAGGNSLSLSGVCDDRGQHAADAVAAAREPCIERLM